MDRLPVKFPNRCLPVFRSPDHADDNTPRYAVTVALSVNMCYKYFRSILISFGNVPLHLNGAVADALAFVVVDFHGMQRSSLNAILFMKME